MGSGLNWGSGHEAREEQGAPPPPSATKDIGKALWMVLGFSRLVAGEKERDRVKKVGTQTCAAKGKKEQFLRCVPQRTENELRDGGKGKWESVHCEGFGVTQAEISNQQLPIGPLLEGKTEMKVKSWIPYSLRVRFWKKMREPR